MSVVNFDYTSITVTFLPSNPQQVSKSQHLHSFTLPNRRRVSLYNHAYPFGIVTARELAFRKNRLPASNPDSKPEIVASKNKSDRIAVRSPCMYTDLAWPTWQHGGTTYQFGGIPETRDFDDCIRTAVEVLREHTSVSPEILVSNSKVFATSVYHKLIKEARLSKFPADVNKAIPMATIAYSVQNEGETVSECVRALSMRLELCSSKQFTNSRKLLFLFERSLDRSFYQICPCAYFARFESIHFKLLTAMGVVTTCRSKHESCSTEPMTNKLYKGISISSVLPKFLFCFCFFSWSNVATLQSALSSLFAKNTGFSALTTFSSMPSCVTV